MIRTGLTGNVDGWANAIAAAIPGAQLILYPGVGHLPQEEIAELSAGDLRAFLTTRVYGVREEALQAIAPE